MTKVSQDLNERLAERGKTNDEMRADNARTKKMLERAEETQEVGLAPRQTKTKTIDASPFGRKFKGRKGRYVHPDKVDLKEDEGWTRVSEERAKQAGLRSVVGTQFVLMEHSQDYVNKRQRAVEEKNRRLLQATRGTFRAVVANEARQLVDAGVIESDKSLLVEDKDLVATD